MHNDMEWSRKVLKYGIGYLQHCATIFGIVSFFVRIFGPAAPTRIVIPPPDKFSAAA